MKVSEKGHTVTDCPKCIEFSLRDASDYSMYGCYDPKNKKILVWAVWTRRKGLFKQMMDTVVDHFNTNLVEFTNVLNDSLKTKLRGFKTYSEPFQGGQIICIKGRWEASE